MGRYDLQKHGHLCKLLVCPTGNDLLLCLLKQDQPVYCYQVFYINEAVIRVRPLDYP